MILYKEDWNKYPDAIADFKTKNKSWLEIAYILEGMGIENHLFPLALHNPILQGFDIENDKITKEIAYALADEVFNNPWYVFREIARVPAQSGLGSTELQANRGNIALYWNFFNNFTPYLIQTRQSGKSISTDELTCNIMNFLTQSSELGLLTKDRDTAGKNIDRLKKILMLYPEPLRTRTKKDPDNSESIFIRANGNKLKSFVGKPNIDDAKNSGRGLSLPYRHIDEFGYVKNIQYTFPVILSTGIAVQEEAKRKGLPYGTVITTTAAYIDTPHGEYAYKKFKEGFKFTEKLYDAQNREEAVKIIRENSSKANKYLLIVSLEYNHLKLGKDDNWLIEKIGETAATELEIKTDFLLQWISGSDENPIDKNYLDRAKKSVIEPIETEITKQGFIIRWFKNKDEYHNKTFIIGSDPSDALGNDYFTFSFRDIRTGETVAEAEINDSNLLSVSYFLFDIMMKYKRSVLNMERRSSGKAVMDNLVAFFLNAGINPFKRMFSLLVHKMDMIQGRVKEFLEKEHWSRDDLDEVTSLVNSNKGFGFSTSGSGLTARKTLFGQTLNQALKLTVDVIYSSAVSKQLSTLTVRDGRLDHVKDGHDDMLVAWMLSFWLLFYGKNLQYYGINPREIFSELDNYNTEFKNIKEESYKKERNKKLRAELQGLLNKIKNISNEMIRDKYITRIRVLEEQLGTEETHMLNIDDVINSIAAKYQKSKPRIVNYDDDDRDLFF